MASLINGIHHVTSCVAGAQEDIDFWTQIIGLRMIKQTVLFDGAASVYHLYYANGDAQPGSVMTTFPFKQAGLYGRTTYAGSEMTPIWGLSEGGYKTTGRNPIVKPVTVIYDPKLTLTLPPGMVVTSAMNSIAHCVEALYAENANPIASLMAEEGARALAQSIPIVIKQPGDLEARANAQYGCWLGGTVLGMVGMALHHKLCHTLGGSFNLPHAETHTVVLPHVTHYNRDHAPQAMAALARALACAVEGVAGRLYDLAKEHGALTSLAELGFKREDLDRAVDLATRNPYYNPRPVTPEGIRDVLENALAGNRPS